MNRHVSEKMKSMTIIGKLTEDRAFYIVIEMRNRSTLFFILVFIVRNIIKKC